MKRIGLVSGAAVSLIAGSAFVAPSAFAADQLPNGYTAKVVAHSGQTIRGAVDATGYDVGIYIGPGVHDVRVIGATVTGANDEGILVQDAYNVLIEHSTVKGNTAHPTNADLEELKGIVLAGTRHVVVAHNTVEYNGDGGIGVYDDGPNSPSTFAPVAIDATPVPSRGNVVFGNLVKDNRAGCGIVVAAKNPNSGGVNDNVVAFNRVLTDPPDSYGAPFIGGIVIAGGEFRQGMAVTNNVFWHNTITGGLIPGISIHGSNDAQITGTRLIGNVMSNNGAGTGVQITPAGATVNDTKVLYDRVSDDVYGVFHTGDTNTEIAHLHTSNVTYPVGP